MGSFNTTCFASNQTIAPGNFCYIFPIKQKIGYTPVKIQKASKEFQVFAPYESTCYSTGFWSYAGPMIKGIYDDYGQFDIIDEPENLKNIKKFFDSLSLILYETIQCKNEYHDLGINFSELYSPDSEYNFDQLKEIWDKFWRVGQENRLFIAHYSGEPRLLSFAVMHKATADFLINKYESLTSWDGSSLKRRDYFNRYIDEMMSRFKPDDEHLNEYLKIRIMYLEGFNIGETEGTHINVHYKQSFNENLFNDIKSLKETFFKECQTLIDHHYINAGLDFLNLKLTPIVYAGQDYDNSIGSSYLEMVTYVNEILLSEMSEEF